MVKLSLPTPLIIWWKLLIMQYELPQPKTQEGFPTKQRSQFWRRKFKYVRTGVGLGVLFDGAIKTVQ